MRHRLVKIAIAATTLLTVACATERLLEPTPMRFATTSSMSVMNPKTHQLETVTVPPLRTVPGVSASYVGSGTDGAVLVATGAPGLAPSSGHVSYSYSDSLHRANKVVVIYRPGGGPPAATYHFLGTQLISTTALSWAHISGGWYISRATTSLVSPTGTTLGSYTLASTYTQTTQPCTKTVTTNCGPPQMVRGPVSPARRLAGYAALALAYSCAPTDALAQWGMHFADCFDQWLLYGIAMAALYGTAGLVPDGPGIAMMASVYGAAVYALKQLVDCMVSHDNAAAAFGGGGSGAAGGAGDNASCDNGGLSCPILYTE